jgi:hypothetical protein
MTLITPALLELQEGAAVEAPPSEKRRLIATSAGVFDLNALGERTPLTQLYPKFDERWCDETVVTSGPTFLIDSGTTTQANQRYGIYGYASSAPALGYSFRTGLWLRAGTYTLSWLGATSNSQGIFTVKVNNSSVGTVDGYSAALTYNTILSIASVVIATSGWQQIDMEATSKQGASSGYYFIFSKMWAL